MARRGPFYRVIFRDRDWKDQVDVQRVTPIADSSGGNLIAVQTLRRRVPCCVIPAALTETLALQRQSAEASHQVVFRADPQVRNGDRLVWDGRLLVVQGWNDEMGLGIIWSLTCHELVA